MKSGNMNILVFLNVKDLLFLLMMLYNIKLVLLIGCLNGGLEKLCIYVGMLGLCCKIVMLGGVDFFVYVCILFLMFERISSDV